MSCIHYQVGDRVSFCGTAGKDGKLISVHQDGETVFEATVFSTPLDVCYSLRWDNGDPVGIPFQDDDLTLLSSRKITT